MPFRMCCTNAGCCETMAPYLDSETNKVFCSECDREIQNVSIFAKNQMRMSKQFKQKEKKSFAVKCSSCGTEDRPKLVNDNIVCSFCNKNIENLSVPFIMMLKMRLGKANTDV